MFEQTSIPFCEGRDATSPGDLDADATCLARERFNILVSQAASFFAGQFHYAGETRAVTDWLARSPCHECAWRRVNRTWDLLASSPTGERD